MFKTFTVALLCLILSRQYALAFTTVTPSSTRFPSSSLLFQSAAADDDEDEQSDDNSSSLQKQQEMVMEELSRIGAAKIATLDVSERTRRAMLAEVLEDAIFESTAELEAFLEDDGTIAEENRSKALKIAEQTKTWQVQYQELVTGKPSSVLSSVEAAVPKTKDMEQ